jgi:hypothetical protein
MTNYNLEEFKDWLEANPEKKENLPSWSTVLDYLKSGKHNFEFFLNEEELKKGGWNLNYVRIIRQWMTEVDQREQQEESNNMVNAPDWLQENFPTKESRTTVKELLIRGTAKTVLPLPTATTSRPSGRGIRGRRKVF